MRDTGGVSRVRTQTMNVWRADELYGLLIENCPCLTKEHWEDLSAQRSISGLGKALKVLPGLTYVHVVTEHWRAGDEFVLRHLMLLTQRKKIGVQQREVDVLAIYNNDLGFGCGPVAKHTPCLHDTLVQFPNCQK